MPTSYNLLKIVITRHHHLLVEEMDEDEEDLEVEVQFRIMHKPIHCGEEMHMELMGRQWQILDVDQLLWQWLHLDLQEKMFPQKKWLL